MIKIESSLLLNVLSSLETTIIFFRSSERESKEVKKLNIGLTFFGILLKVKIYEYHIDLNEENQLMADMLKINKDTILVIKKENFHRLDLTYDTINKIQQLVMEKE